MILKINFILHEKTLKIIKNQEKRLRKVIKAQENLKTQGKKLKTEGKKLEFSAYSYVGPEEKMAKK